nr:uncharacterized protein LOC121121591 [Lepeophtheirus salmonis]
MLDSDLYDSESTTNFFEEDVEGVDVDPSTTGNTFKKISKRTIKINIEEVQNPEFSRDQECIISEARNEMSSSSESSLNNLNVEVEDGGKVTSVKSRIPSRKIKKTLLSKSIKKSKKRIFQIRYRRNIDIDNVSQFSSILNGNDFEPPEELSPRSAAKYVQNLLISKVKKKTRPKKKTKVSSKLGLSKDGKKKGRKRRRKRRKKKNKNKTVDDEEEDDPLFLTKVASEQDQHFFPTPESMKKKRCAFIVEYNPLQCNICEGIHFRTKKTFQQNLDIIASVNESFGQVLGDMGSKMSFINVNLQKVKDNLDQLECLYSGIFRRVDKLIA